MDILENCRLCPHNCGVNRYESVGLCGAGSKLKVAYYSLHQWEEPVISAENGSGTVFFSHCNLKCIFCQNKKISTLGYGKEISEERLGEIFLELQDKGTHNINLVTPTHFVPQIASVLRKLRKGKLYIPIVYNTSSYENVETLKMVDGLVDIYLADLKYKDNVIAKRYSKVDDYFEVATRAIEEMYRQVGAPLVKDNVMLKGLIVRILILPGHIDDAKDIIEYLWNRYKDNIFISIMNQYTPLSKNYPFNNLNRIVTEEEYDEVINYACDLGITKAFIQEGGTADESFIPEFDCDIV